MWNGTQRMIRLLLLSLLVLMSSVPALAQPEAERPRYLRELNQQYRAGDWILQCDSWAACHIMGVASTTRADGRLRPVIMIRRGWKRGDSFEMRIALIDGYGEVLKPASGQTGWFLARRTTRAPRAIGFTLDRTSREGAFPVTGTDLDRLVGVLRRWPDGWFSLGNGTALPLPRGNLDYLLRKMERLQFPKKDPLSKSQRADWMREYHYRFLPIARAQAGVPDEVTLACQTVTYATSAEGWQLDSRHRLWIAQCPEASRLFLQVDQNEPIDFDLKDREGRVQPRLRAHVDQDGNLLEIRLSHRGRGDCGQFIRFGWTDQARFGMIEHRVLNTCRFVPAQFWPMGWTPSSWKFVAATPLD